MRKKPATHPLKTKENIDHAFEVSNLRVGLLLNQRCQCGSKISSSLNGNNDDVEQWNWRQAEIPQIMSCGVLGIWLNANSGYDKKQGTHKIRQDAFYLMSATICKYHLLLWIWSFFSGSKNIHKIWNHNWNTKHINNFEIKNAHTTYIMIFYGKIKGKTSNDKAIQLLDIYMYCLNQVKRKYIEQDHLVHSGIWLNS